MRRIPERHLLIVAPKGKGRVPTLLLSQGLALRCVWCESLPEAVAAAERHTFDLVFRALPFTCGRLETHFLHRLRAQADPLIVMLLPDEASRLRFDSVLGLRLGKGSRILFLEDEAMGEQTLGDLLKRVAPLTLEPAFDEAPVHASAPRRHVAPGPSYHLSA